MRNLNPFVFFTFFILLAALPEVRSEEPPSRATLENSWRAYVDAAKTGNEAALEKTMSAYRLGTMKNFLTGSGQTLASNVFQRMASTLPNISEAEFVSLKVNGPTAGMVFVTNSKQKDAQSSRGNSLFIKFVKEDSIWKVDGQIGNFGNSKFDLAHLPPTYELDGQVLGAPKVETKPDVPAFLDVTANGYKIQVTVNGKEQYTTIDQSSSGILAGGLRKGTNSIVVIIDRTEKDEGSAAVTIRRLFGLKTVEVFKYEPEKDIRGKHTFDLNIDQ